MIRPCKFTLKNQEAEVIVLTSLIPYRIMNHICTKTRIFFYIYVQTKEKTEKQ